MRHRITSHWNNKADWFRDADQLNAVATIILHCLADDRIEDECRYLVRLEWHLHMSYQEVSYDELLKHVATEKMAVLDQLFDAVVDSDYRAIDSWIADCKRRLPIIRDKWIENNRDSDYVSDLLNNGM